MTFVSRAESVNQKNGYSTASGASGYSFPTLYYDCEMDHRRQSDSSSFDEESTSPDYKIKYAGMCRVADSTLDGDAVTANNGASTTNATTRRRQMFTSLVQYLIWRRPSQDNSTTIVQQTTVLDKHFDYGQPARLTRLITSTDNVFEDALESVPLDQCHPFGRHRDDSISVSTNGTMTADADGVEADLNAIKDELSTYMEEIRMREIK